MLLGILQDCTRKLELQILKDASLCLECLTYLRRCGAIDIQSELDGLRARWLVDMWSNRLLLLNICGAAASGDFTMLPLMSVGGSLCGEGVNTYILKE